MHRFSTREADPFPLAGLGDGSASRALPRVLLIASDTIGERMAGSGIRYWNLARVLGAQQPVTLATPNATTLDAPSGVTLISYSGASEDERGTALTRLIEAHDVIVAQQLPFLYAGAQLLASKQLVIDLYAPWILEKLEYARVDPARGEPNRKDDVTILNRLLELGDFFLCASERQRDFWLGALAAAGRLELEHMQADPELRNLIDVVAFGLPETRPARTGPGPRALVPGVGQDALVLLWNGGLWNWLDPLTAIRATALLARDEPRLRLVFMGTRSPGAQVAEMAMVATARELAQELGLLDSHVFFNDWVDYEQRQNWLLDADIALSLHVATVEARYAYRTRLLDNIWCGVPTVATEGDVLAEIVDAQQIGLTTPPGDAAAVAAAIGRILQPEVGRAMRANLATAAQRFTWERVSAPLLAYCRAPWQLGVARGIDAQGNYTRGLEQLYSETAQYARQLERVLAEKDAALQLASAPAEPRRRPDLGELFRRGQNRRG